jgi:hypothetical protein
MARLEDLARRAPVETYRQGDVILIRADPDGERLGAPVPREQGRVVLARGELTGHAHAIRAPEARLFERAGQPEGDAARALGARVLLALAPVRLEHEEHAAIDVPPGTWLVRIQREYSPEALRSVAD